MLSVAETAEQFAELIKPYIDDTPTTEGMFVWPLINAAIEDVNPKILEDPNTSTCQEHPI